MCSTRSVSAPHPNGRNEPLPQHNYSLGPPALPPTSPSAMDSAIDEAVAQGLRTRNDAALLSACAAVELSNATQGRPHPHAALHLLALLLTGDLTEARFLWRRLPNACRADGDTAAAWGIGQAMWRRDQRAVYAGLRGRAWGPAAAPLIARLEAVTSEAAARLITRAYSVVSIERTATLLGCGVAEIAGRCERLGWRIEDGFVVPGGRSEGAATTKGEEVSYQELQSLTEQLVRLQTAT